MLDIFMLAMDLRGAHSQRVRTTPPFLLIFGWDEGHGLGMSMLEGSVIPLG
jgi:hypothetical protein